jgi:microcystin-dependent protein
MKKNYAVLFFILLSAVSHAQNVGIGTNAPTYKLDVVGDVNVKSGYGYRVNGSAGNGQYLRGDGTRFTPSAIPSADLPGGSGYYIWNGTTLQAGDFRISGIGSVGSMGIGVSAPSPSAALDVVATNKGVSFPNVTLQSATDAVTIPNPVKGLLVYNPGTVLAPAGIYINNGTAGSPNWQKLSDASGTLSSIAVTSPVTSTGGNNPTIGLGVVPVTLGGTGLTAVGAGQILIGNGSNTFVNANLTGTGNQVNVNSAAGSITLSTPQDIATTSNVTFNRATLNTAADVNSLDAGRSIKIGNTGQTAGAAGAGAVRYNGGNVEYSDGTNWKNLSTGGTVTAVTASNGLNATTSGTTTDVKLGGTLSSATTIANAGNNLYITGAGNLGVGDNSAPARVYVKGDGTNPIIAAVDNTNVAKLYVDPAGKVGVNTNAPGVSLDVRTTDAVKMPSGTSAQRPVAPLAGTTRFNTDCSCLEYYDGTQWVSANTTQVPVGTIAPYGGNTAPAGWLLCDGSAVSRTTYVDLFNAIGITFGSGNGTTTFNLPNLQGKAPFGLGAAPYNTLGATGGGVTATPSLTPSLSVDIAAFNAALPNHTHDVPGHYHNTGAGGSLVTTSTNSGGGTAHSHTVDPAAFNTTDGAGGHNHGRGGTGSVGGNNYGLIMQSSGGSNTIASTDQSVGEPNIVTSPRELGLATDGAHNHSIDVPSTTSSSESAHTHNIPSVAVTGSIGLTGGSNGNAAFPTSAMSAANVSVDPPSTAITGSVSSSTISTANPYQVVNYIIKATNTANASITAVNLSTGSFGQTLYYNAGWVATSNLYNNGTSVGIGTTAPAKALDIAGVGGIRISRTEGLAGTASNNEIFFQDNGQIRSVDDNHRLIFDRANNTIEMREYGDLVFSPGSTAGTRTQTVTFKSGGNVGIDDATPVAMLTVGNGDLFQVNSAGAIAAATGITSSGTITLSGLNTNGLVRTTGTNGVLSIGQAVNADIANGAITDAKVNDVNWSKVTNRPTTLAGYGITDASSISGTVNRVIKFTSGTTAGNSNITDDGNIIQLSPPTYTHFTSGNVYVQSSLIARGGILNDGGDVTVNDNLYSTGNIYADGIVYWGNGQTRTETRDNAGQQSTRSGFYETSNPSNYYAGASSWQHLLDIRHSNSANNYAMQFAGSFFDQRVYVRKTDNSATKAWSSIQTAAQINTRTGASATYSTGVVTMHTSNNVDVKTGESYMITFIPDIRNTNGSGNDRWRLTLNYSGCASGTVNNPQVTTTPYQDHNNWYTYTHIWYYQATCDGTINFSALIERFDSDDTWQFGDSRMIITRM